MSAFKQTILDAAQKKDGEFLAMMPLMSITQMVDVHNDLIDIIDLVDIIDLADSTVKPVTKFRTKGEAIVRVTKLFNRYCEYMNNSGNSMDDSASDDDDISDVLESDTNVSEDDECEPVDDTAPDSVEAEDSDTAALAVNGALLSIEDEISSNADDESEEYNENEAPAKTPGKRGRKSRFRGQRLWMPPHIARSGRNPHRRFTRGWNSYKIIMEFNGLTYEEYVAKGGNGAQVGYDFEHGLVTIGETPKEQIALLLSQEKMEDASVEASTLHESREEI